METFFLTLVAVVIGHIIYDISKLVLFIAAEELAPIIKKITN